MKASRASVWGLVGLILVVSAASQWWGHRQEARMGERIAALAGPGDLQMISSDTCGICAMARRWFGDHGIRYEECSIERDAACRERYRSLGEPGTPVMVVRGQAQLGFSPPRLEQALRAAS